MVSLSLVLLLGLFVVSLYLFFRKSSPNVGRRVGQVRMPINDVLKKMSTKEIKYKPVNIPQKAFTGFSLRIVSRLQHTVFARLVAFPLIHKQSGTDLLSGEYIPEEPTFSPAGRIPRPMQKDGLADGNKEALESLIQSYSPNLFNRRTSMDFYNAYKSGSCEPIDVARCVLKAITQSNSSSQASGRSVPPLRAIVQVNERDVLKMAQESTSRWAKGSQLGYLDGVPVSIKGHALVPPYKCSAGSSFQPAAVESLPLSTECILVTRLKQAGAIIVGMANLQEFCTGITGSNSSKAYQTPRNPYNTDHFCGGSSSGSGSSVSAGLCTISIGSDAGGSIRIPAAHCGVAGLKPTYQLLDGTGFTPLTHTVGSLGPIAPTAVDLAIVMDTLCSDKGILDLSDLSHKSLKGIKLGVFWEFFESVDDQEIVAVCKEVVRNMVSTGAECIDIRIPELAEVREAHTRTVSTEFCTSLSVEVDKNFDKLCGETSTMIALGASVSGKDYINSQKQRTRSIRTLEVLFEEVDVIITPTVACLAPKIPPGADKSGMVSSKLVSSSIQFASLANLTGIPAVTVPVGMSSTGLPISIQVQGPWYKEGRLLRIATQLERVYASNVKRPQAYYDVLGLATL